jgi:hypothetical protein
MAGTESSEMSEHLLTARACGMTDRDCVLQYLRRELQHVLSQVRPQDLSTAEVAGLSYLTTDPGLGGRSGPRDRREQGQYPLARAVWEAVQHRPRGSV